MVKTFWVWKYLGKYLVRGNVVNGGEWALLLWGV
ncbi:hypothetical protein VP424E501_P0161 [Vibrio phage 424E50-1]|nr:hypothetical protein VP424E501_P0161 [Vibrio phage 424E50-1]